VEDRLRLTIMPIYEYQCASCRKKTEFIQNFSDAPPEKCPKCGGALRKLLSSPAFQFKGSGFYATDYGKQGGKDEESASKDRDGEGSSKEKDGESSSREKDGESSSNVKEGGGDAKSEGGAEPKGDSAGEKAKDSKHSKDSPRELKDSGKSAAKKATRARTSTAPSRKNSDTE